MKKKKILWIILPIIIVLVAGIAIVATLYFATDMFKSPEELFWKNFSKNSEITNLFESEFSAEQEAIVNKSFTANGKVAITIQDKNENEQVINLGTKTNYDAISNKTYMELALNGKNEDILTMSFVNSGNVYALKCDKVLEKYIGIKNENLGELLEKLGMPVNTTFQISDSITATGVNFETNLTQEQKEAILERYKEEIVKVIPQEAYEKLEKVPVTIDSVSYNLSGYSLTLTPEVLKQILTNVITKLQNDQEVKQVIIDILNSSNSNENWATQLDEAISEMLQATNEMELEESLAIKVYTDGKNVYKTTFSVGEDEIAIDFTNNSENTKQKVIIAITGEAIDTDYNSYTDYGKTKSNTIKISIEKTEDDSKVKNYIELVPNSDDSTTYSLSIEEGKVQNNNSNNVIEFNIYNSDGTYVGVNLNNDIQYGTTPEIPDLNNQNTYILNNYTAEQLQPFMEQLGEKISEVASEVALKVMMNMNSLSAEDLLNSIYGSEENEEIQENQEYQDVMNNDISNLLSD